jgi:hypothetical protein
MKRGDQEEILATEQAKPAPITTDGKERRELHEAGGASWLDFHGCVSGPARFSVWFDGSLIII